MVRAGMMVHDSGEQSRSQTWCTGMLNNRYHLKPHELVIDVVLADYGQNGID